MGKICWDFPLLGTGNQRGSNNAAITMFKGSGIMDGLSREICQNSLDAKDPELPTDSPVKVKFELIELKKSEYSMFDGYEKALDSGIAYWEKCSLCTPKIKEFLTNVKTALQKDTIPTLVMSDYNTIGLQGVNAKDDEKSFWDLLVNTDGISIKQDSNSAGSFGIGKYAPFAYSSLNLVFYNTLAKDGGRAFEGVTHLVTTQKEYNGTMLKTQPTGKYLYLKNDYESRPILPSDNCKLAMLDIFNRTEIGTDVAIVGFKESDYDDWEKNISVAVIKNFILAILNGKLEVTVKSSKTSYEINKTTLDTLLYQTFSEETQLKYTRQIHETITMTKPHNVKIAEKNDLSIYIRYDDKYSQSLSRFRSTGMLINTVSRVLPHFSVVLVVNAVDTKELDSTLKESEPPQHTEWKASNITDNRTLHNKVKRYLAKINKEVQKALDEFEKAETTDKIDAGIGNYLPDTSDDAITTEGADGLKTDVKISEITSYDGRIIYNQQYDSAESSIGEKNTKKGIKTGKRKRKKKTGTKITVVTPGKGSTTGVAKGSGKVKITSANITDHRTYYIAGKKYRAYVNSPADYNNVYIQYFAGREDNKEDPLFIKNVKLDKQPIINVNGKKIGPISLRQGKNIFYVEFDSDELLAVIPVFTQEV